MQKVRLAIAKHKKHAPFAVLFVLLIASIFISVLTTIERRSVNAVPAITYESTIPSSGSRMFNVNFFDIDDDGNFYVINDKTYTIKKISPSGQVLGQYGGAGVTAGLIGGRPQFIALDNFGDIYVSAEDFYIYKFQNDGTYVTKWGGYGTGSGQFANYPHFTFDANNIMHVVNHGKYSVETYDASGTYIGAWGAQGASDGQFDTRPTGVDIDASGDVYVVEDKKFQKFESDGTFIARWGVSGCCGGNGTFGSGWDIEVDDSNGDMYIVDRYQFSRNVQRFDSSGNHIAQWGSVVAGPSSYPVDFFHNGNVVLSGSGTFFTIDWADTSLDPSGFSYIREFNISDGSLANTLSSYSDGQVTTPVGTAIDSENNRYVADVGHGKIQKFDEDGNFLLSWGAGNLQIAQATYRHVGIAVDSNDNVYVARSGDWVISKYDSSGNFITEWGSNGSGDGQFNRIAGIGIDSNDNVYVADRTLYRVQKFASDGTFLTKWGSMGTTNGRFAEASGIAIDSNDNVFVSDRSLRRVQKFSSVGAYISKWGSSGTGDGQFTYPDGMSVDAQNNVYVADSGSNRVQKFSNTGTYLQKWGSKGGADGQFIDSVDIDIDQNGRMLVTDYSNNRVQQFQYGATVSIDTLSLPDGKVSDPYSTTIQVSGAEGTLVLSTTGTIPPGLIFNTSTAEISGTPTAEGDYTFTVYASDDYNTVSREYTVTIAPITPIRIVTDSLPDGAIDVNYSEPVEAEDINGTASWSVTAGALPTGLAINTTDGTVNGAPTQPGTFTFTVRVEDDLSSDTKELSILVPALPAIQITTTSLPSGIVGSSYSTSIETANSSGSITFTQTLGALPGGLSISSGAGVISGIPTREGAYTFTVRVTDQYGSDSKEFSVLIKPTATTVTTTPNGPETEGGAQTNTGVEDVVPGGVADSSIKRSLNKESVAQSDRESRAALVVRNFPWLLILLLATLALQSAFEAIMQINDTKKVRALVARQKLLNEEKKSLVSLASHYLRTPVTLIASGVEMMSGESSAKTVLQNGVKKLQSTIGSLIGKLESTEVNNTLVAPGEPARSRVSLWAPRVVWPLIGSLVFIALINVVAIFWQEISSTALLIAAQVAILLVIGVLHLLAHNTFKRGSENYQYEKRLLTYQQQLDHLRNKFLREVNEELVPAVVSIDTHLVSGSSEKSAKYIKDGIAQLESTAQKFILISQLEEGAITQNASDINLHEAAQSAKDGLNDDRRLVAIDIPHSATIHQPEFLMRTVLQSLLTNAAEHSKPDQAITVRARRHRKITDISVIDKGEGISAEKLAKLFKPLSRAESSEDFSHEGIGLSLYINQLIMHYLGGSISATSRMGKGVSVKVVTPNAP